MGVAFILTALALLFGLGVALAAFERCLLSLRYRLLVEGDRDAWLKARSVRWVTARAKGLPRVLRLVQGGAYMGFGVLMYVAVRWVFGAGAEVSGVRVLGALGVALAAHYIGIFVLSRLLAVMRPRQVLTYTAWLVLAFDGLLRPLFWVLGRIEGALLKGHEELEAGILDSLDAAVQIRAMAREEVTLKPVLRNILNNALRMRDLEVSDILLPRAQVQYFDINAPLEENLRKARQTGHTRFPLCDGDLDRCIGLVHIKDLFRHEGDGDIDLRRMRRNMLSLSVDDPIDEALQRLLLRKMHMARVTDEFGGTVGVVTLESILEELVGDIQDEFDAEESLIRQLGLNRYRISGLAPVHEVEQTLGVSFEDEEASTFGGLITAQMGRIPDQGERLRIEETRLEIWIDEVDEKRVISTVVEIAPLDSTSDLDEGV